MPHKPWDASWHLRVELSRILAALAAYLRRQRQRGRTPVGDAVQGLIIEQGEAEGLIAELTTPLDADAPHDRNRPTAGHQLREIAERAAAGEGAGAFLPLRHAQRVFELTSIEYDAVLLALAVEIDARFGRVIAYLNDHAGRTRPTLGLAVAIASLDDPSPLHSLLERPFVRDGLIDVEGDAPAPGKTIKLPRGVAARLSGAANPPAEHWLSVHAPDMPLLDRLTLEERARERLTKWSDTLRGRRSGARLLIVGTEGSGRTTAARSALFRAGFPVIQVELTSDTFMDRLRAARREARWNAAAVVARWPATSPQPIDWPSFWAALAPNVPTIVVLSSDQASDASAAIASEPATIRIEEPDVPLRTRLWRALLPSGIDIEDSEVAELAGRFPFGPGRIARSVRRATADLCLRPAGERRLDFSSLLEAARAVDSASIGPLAQKIPLPYAREDLIVPPEVVAELDLAIAWVRHRHRVLHEWGFVRRLTMGHGLTALFSGASGTGKTMAAQVLARELNLDLYRIDLSQIMSKYIGETEKNLALVFGARVGVLFFDEAEALLGRRHETRDARDRYANVEIAYLLQRMEEYDGVTVLATNRMRDIDEAFIRRLHLVVDFPMPSEADRLRIWRGMLPKAAELAPDLDLVALAREFDLSGGQIKNAALAGAYLAAADGRPIGMDHLRRAATRELVKSGKVVEKPA
jgi:hypothetical protein